MKRLDGKTALVTGAARGIGAAIATAFVENGAFVYLSDINDAMGQALAAALGATARYIHLDVREESHWQAAMAQILGERAGLNVLVNNAGITGFEDGCLVHDPEHVSLADWH
ncbi:SDR family NAD(P)-dependent oxidoreductase, partial [Thauera sp.]|uniref:SDR family NAD(P)-dependent oxidoreductase n=1 Tax=Thauera sp. TaxID=1905334 RepID=UPI002C0B8D1A